MKQCSRCKQTKDAGDFYKDKQQRSGLTCHCKTCLKEKRDTYYQENKEQIKAWTIAYNKVNRREHQTWYDMIYRCTRPQNRAYMNYGGRGIKVLYKDFDEFIQDVGSRPGPEYSIDRIDNDGHYEPGNCRWATREQQNNNKRNCKNG